MTRTGEYLVEASRIPTPLVAPRERPPIPIRSIGGRSWSRRLVLTVRLLRWAGAFQLATLRGRSPGAEIARRLRDLLQEIGGIGVKIGQLLSLRPDVFSEEFCDVLVQLQFHVVGFPFEDVRRTIEEDLGRPLEEVFDVFEPVPLAAASIAQVHRARLRGEGTWVVAKVQRPGVAQQFRRDLGLLARWIGIVRRLPSQRHLSWDEMVAELEQVVLEEIDYRYEAANTRRMRKTLARHGVRVPKVFPYSTSRLLVLEYLPGVLMSDLLEVGHRDPQRLGRWLAENEVDLDEVGRRLYFTFQRQINEDNLFHGDLHPGNILVFREGRIGLIDLGSIGTLDAETVRKLLAFNRAIAENDFVTATDYNILFFGQLPAMHIERLRPEVGRTLRAWAQRTRVRDLSYEERSFTHAGIEVSRIFARHRVQISWQFMRINRAGTTLEASLRFLQPDADHGALMREYIRDAERRQARQAGRRLGEAAQGLQEEAGFAMQLLEKISMDRARSFESAASKLTAMLSILFGLCEVLSLALLFVIALHWMSAEAIEQAVGGISVDLAVLDRVLLLGLALAAIVSMRRLRGYFALPEVRRE